MFPVVYVVLSEIFPTGVRGKAVSVVSAVNWATNLLISMTFLSVTGNGLVCVGCRTEPKKGLLAVRGLEIHCPVLLKYATLTVLTRPKRRTAVMRDNKRVWGSLLSLSCRILNGMIKKDKLGI